jgi:cob(I)alamin adenosyltransferase
VLLSVSERGSKRSWPVPEPWDRVGCRFKLSPPQIGLAEFTATNVKYPTHLSNLMTSENGLGMVHVYTGNGKGKTTASLGLGMRAAGHGYKVLMIQFMKGDIKYGELEAAKKIPNFEILQFGRPDFVDKKNPAQIDIDLARKGLEHARKVVKEGKIDLLILDEVNVAVEWGLVSCEDVLKVVKSRPKKMEIVLTGRYAPKEFIEIADTVTEMKEIKHPFQKDILARKGVEY